MVFALFCVQLWTMKIVVICVLLTTLVSCSKTKEDAGSDKRTELLTNKKWQLISNISLDSVNTQTDLYTPLEAFKKDDYVIFNTDSTYELNDNVLLENDSTSRILDSGHWRFNEDRTQLLRTSDMYVRDYEPATIQELSENKLVIRTEFTSDRSAIITQYIRIP